MDSSRPAPARGGTRLLLAAVSLGLAVQLLDGAHQLLSVETMGEVALHAGVTAIALVLMVPFLGALGLARAAAVHDDLVSLVTRRLEERLAARPLLWNVVFAALALFLEMSLIRWTSYLWLANYRNLVLLGCFLGLGLGFISGRRRLAVVPYLLPILGIQYLELRLLIEIDQRPDALPSLLPATLAAVFVSPQWQFLLVVLATLAPGQLVGALLARRNDLGGYGANLAGSVLGVVGAYLLAALWTPPTTWLGVAALTLLWAFPGAASVLAATALAFCLVLSSLAAPPEQLVVYSPYQRLGLRPAGFGHELGDGRIAVTANSVYYQSIPAIATVRVRPELDVEHRIANADLGPVLDRLPGARVLALGAGAGANVAQLLRAGVASVVAVDIDPVIVHFGRTLNADRPYDDPRVEVVVDDARAYLRASREQFDFISFFWIDSHPGSSNSAGLRLDSFVYTRECFRQCKARLAPGGQVLLYAWMTPLARRRILHTMEDAFATTVRTYRIPPWEYQWLFAVGPSGAAAPGPYAIPTPLPDASGAAILTDDWPFLYAGEETPGVAGFARFLSFVVGASLVGAWLAAPGHGRARGRGRELAAFFLFGVAFMLVETVLIMQVALIFGNTWLVVGQVVVAILLMAFAGNLAVLRGWVPRRPIIHAVGLMATLLLIWRFRAADILAAFPDSALGPWAYVVLAALPVFFSSVLFSIFLDGFPAVDAALGSNLLGAMVGGCLEYLAMVVGYQAMTLAIPAIYLLALVVRGSPDRAATSGA